MAVKFFLRTLILFVFVCSVACDSGGPAPATRVSYLDKLKTYQTALTSKGPAPQEWGEQELPVNVELITYESDGMSLKAWVYIPDSDHSKKRPALVFFHGGFAFGAGDMFACQKFIDAGYIVLCPMLRGENGNPGSHELFLGEVSDAKNAVKWLADQSYVNKQKIYAFGHSVGGGISALLTLRDDVPIQHSGSAGGLYGPSLFGPDGWNTPFDSSNAKEVELRTLVGNIRDMNYPHYAYLGEEDSFSEQINSARQEVPAGDSKLAIKVLPGDHFSSFEPALDDYLKLIESGQ